MRSISSLAETPTLGQFGELAMLANIGELPRGFLQEIIEKHKSVVAAFFYEQAWVWLQEAVRAGEIDARSITATLVLEGATNLAHEFWLSIFGQTQLSAKSLDAAVPFVAKRHPGYPERAAFSQAAERLSRDERLGLWIGIAAFSRMPDDIQHALSEFQSAGDNIPNSLGGWLRWICAEEEYSSYQELLGEEPSSPNREFSALLKKTEREERSPEAVRRLRRFVETLRGSEQDLLYFRHRLAEFTLADEDVHAFYAYVNIHRGGWDVPALVKLRAARGEKAKVLEIAYMLPTSKGASRARAWLEVARYTGQIQYLRQAFFLSEIGGFRSSGFMYPEILVVARDMQS